MITVELGIDKRTAVTGQTAQFEVHFGTGQRGRRQLRSGARPVPPVAPARRIPRISLLLALVVRFDRMVREGTVRDYADIARMGGVTRARVSQIMDLLNLAPDIQEEIIMLPRTPWSLDSVTERGLRRVVAEPDWQEQRRLWQDLTGT